MRPYSHSGASATISPPRFTFPSPIDIDNVDDWDWMPDRRKMLVITHGYPPLQNHGAELHIQRKVQWWRSRGHDVRVIAANPRSESEMPHGRVYERTACVNGVEVLRVTIAAPDASQPLRLTYNHPMLRPILAREIKSYEPDVIVQVSGYVFGLLPLELAEQYDIPSILFVTDFWHACQRHTLLRPDGSCCDGPRHPADCAACRLSARNVATRSGPTMTGRIWALAAAAGRAQSGLLLPDVRVFAERETLVARALKSVSLVVANSGFLARWMIGLGVPEERVITVRQGINTDERWCPETQEPDEPDEAGLRVLYIGQIAYHKGVDTLITSVNDLHTYDYDIQLRMYGPYTDNSLLPDLPEQASQGAIQHCGPTDRAGVKAALRWADVLVVPSRWFENSPNVVLEAFASGVPVVAANHGGMAEMVRDGIDGLFFRPGDSTSLMLTLRRLADEPDLLQTLRAGITQPHDVRTEMLVEEVAIEHILSSRLPHRVMQPS